MPQSPRGALLAALLASALTCVVCNSLPPGWHQESLRSADDLPHMVVLDADARIFLMRNFLSPEECDHIISLAEPQLHRSQVVDVSATGGEATSEVRTSSGTFLERGQDPIVASIEERIARWTLMPSGNGEGLQVLRYFPGQQYEGHFDYFAEEETAHQENGGNRYATVLTYLNDVEEGGETTFPNIPAPGGDNGPGFSDCARYHLAAKPRKGDAVLFHSITASGAFERRSLHTACPVIRGVKWSMPKWIRVGHFSVGGEPIKPVPLHPQHVGEYGCADNHEWCGEWRDAGRCETDVARMVGTRMRPGECLVSCGRCDILADTGGRRAYQHDD